ncbi:MAG: hypothetical protein ACXW4G_08820 [Candidatus Deferrimicrobiaceae bacterium]
MWTAVTGLLLAVSPRIASAGVAETVREDLRPISGYVVMQQEGDYLVDLDAGHGLRVGDLLSVVTKGKEVIHPLTKEVIGRLDEAKAVLQVTQMKSGFSVARPLPGAGNIATGDIVRRFSYLKTVFQGSSEQSRALYEELRKALPELEWQGLFSAGERSGTEAKPDLLFTREDGELRLLDREGHPLRAWAYPEADKTGGQKPVAEALRQPARPESVPSPPASAPGPAGKDSSSVRWSAGGIDFGPFTSMGELPSRVLMSAFARDPDQLLLATADGNRVRVFSVAGGLRQLAVAEIGDVAVSPLAVAWWRPAKTGPLYLVVTAGEEVSRSSGTRVETKLSGAIYEFAGQSLRLEASGIRYFLGTFDRDGDGISETLLGQEFSLRDEYGRTFVLNMEGGKIVASKPGFELPREFTVPGSALGDLTGDGKQETAYVRNGVLWIYSGKERIYRSSKEMGGSISTITYDRNPDVKDSMISVLSLEVPPFLHDIDGDGIPELLVVGAETGIVQVPGIGPGVKKSWVNVVKFQAGTFRKGRLPGDLENPIQGIWADGKQVYLVVSRTTSIMSKEGSSTLLTLPLERISK